jgi:S-DNA-T family DNA segregation ATPase FtsK/SpoIIIE
VTNPQPLMIASGLTFAVASIGMGLGMAFQQKSSARNRTRTQRERYLDYIAETRATVNKIATQQRRSAAFRHPGPDELPILARSDVRRWERRCGDGDFLVVRVGAGTVGLAAPLRLEDRSDPLAWSDPVCTVAARKLVEVHGRLTDQPIVVPLETSPIVSLVGPARVSRAAARAVVAQLTTLHAPDDVRIAICAPRDGLAEWDHLKWLPHFQPTLRADGVATGPSVCCDAEELHSRVVGELEALTRATPVGETADTEPAGRRLVVVSDGIVPSPETIALLRRPNCPVRILVLVGAQREEPTAVTVRLRFDDIGGVEVEPVVQQSRSSARPGYASEAHDEGAQAAFGRADQLGINAAEAIARMLAPIRLSAASEGGTLSRSIGLQELLGIDDLSALELDALWKPRPVKELLRVPMGFDPEGNSVILDIKEADLGGDGPHGLVVGATGSGKSELLRTIITGLALTHSPAVLSFVLVDFKGGAAFSGLSTLPHVAGLITNLADDLALVDRMYAALFGEVRRRQEMLKAAGNVASVRDYHKLQAAGKDLPPLPYVLLVVDEFGELLSNRPEFIDLFIAVGRLGRSLGMHLLLSSQQLEEGRLRGLESHLSYRIALRTFSAAESRTVLGVPDAYYLPSLPGSGYVKAGPSSLRRFRAATVSQPARMGPVEVATARPEPFTLVSMAEPAAAPASGAPKAATSPARTNTAQMRTVVDVVVDRLVDAAAPVHQVWQAPLPRLLTLDAVVGPLVVDAERGLQAESRPADSLQIPMGLVDRPGDQIVAPFMLDLSGTAGHVVIVGAPQTGKSTMLRTLVMAMALTHTPREVEIHAIDFGGGSLAGLEQLPHVGTVCGRGDPERVRRTVAEISARIDARERHFRSRGIESAAALRQARAQGKLDEQMPDVFLVIDNWPALRADNEDLDAPISDLASRGLGYGLHLILTASRWLDVRKQLADSIAGRFELRLQEPSESSIERKAAANVPVGVPGRGLTAGPLHVQIALPRTDGKAQAADIQRAVDELSRRAAEAWHGSRVAQIRVLPARLPLTDLPASGDDKQPGLPLGIAETDLSPVYVDLPGRDGHLLVLGDGESGKTTTLRTFLTMLQSRATPQQAQVSLVDYRRKLLTAVDDEHRVSYAFGASMAAAQAQELAGMLQKRLPHAGLTLKELQAGRWWSGPEVYLVIDDYELVATSSGNPLAPLADLLPQARDIGLHVVVARRVRGLSRSFDSFLNGMRDQGGPGLLLSGDPQEGIVMGQYRATAQAPGRGLLIRRGERAITMQVALTEP